ncbi:MAG: hypothetical protein K6E53_03375 [Lachnospiraceae bacterium]|nr:hypothetical protein [Lachnospiraceae bacterium]
METGKLFDEYFRKFRDVEKILEIMGIGNSDNGSEQLAFDVRSYCLIHRLFVEELKAEPEASAMALRLFGFPPLMPCFRERMRVAFADEWTGIWTGHLMKMKPIFFEGPDGGADVYRTGRSHGSMDGCMNTDGEAVITDVYMNVDEDALITDEIENEGCADKNTYENKKIFIWYLINTAQDWRDWMKGLDKHFVRITAEEGFARFATFMRECSEGVMTGEEIMREYIAEGFTRELECYRSLEEMLEETGMMIYNVS